MMVDTQHRKQKSSVLAHSVGTEPQKKWCIRLMYESHIELAKKKSQSMKLNMGPVLHSTFDSIDCSIYNS